MSNQNQQQQIMTAEEELLDSTAQSVLRHILDGDGNIIDMSSTTTNNNNNKKRNLQSSVHDNTAEELNANDESGMQGGQVWQSPTTKPTSQPSISSKPTSTPTFAPVLNNLERTLRGVMWYDRNGNGVRDSNVEVGGFSNDVEFEFGVGGVQVQLVECDPVTGGQLANADNFASTMTVGFDALMRPQIVPSNDMGGKFNIHLEGLNRYYYVQVQTPSGLLLTSGVCNDDEVGWACDTSTAVTFAQGRDRELLSSSSSSSSSSSAAAALITPASIENSHRALEGEVPIGISSGRSSLCMFVDGDGNVESSFNFGVMRVGDTQNMVSNVALVLEFDDNITSSGGRRRLSEIIRRATVVDEVDNGSSGITTRYLLADEDRVAIGTVTAEVIAGTLDGRLAANGVNLDSVDPKEVIMSHTRPTDAASAAAAQAKLAVGMEIRGHYSPPPDLDFDYIVQDSINRDTATIRRGLREFNRNCREQTSKVNKEGLQESDFEAVISTSGAARPGRGGGRPTTTGGVSSNGNVFSTACSSDFLVPQYFETSLKEIETRELSEVQKLFGDATYDASDGLDSWAMGPVAGLSGLIILLMGAFVFRRALGPRSVDKFSDFNKTKDISKDETRRFGEAFDDDDSVDSAFYSDHDDDDSDMELTEKERKMRRKRKEKEDEQRKGKSGGKTAKERAAERKALAKSTTKKYRKSARKGESSSSDVRKSSRKTEVTISQGSDDTGSLSDDEREKKRAAKERAAERKRLAQSEGPHRKSTSSKKKSSSSRGRNRSSGGDNRKLAASIV